MRKDVQNFFDKNGVKVELKGYRELKTSDAYHMIGNIYINGKKSHCLRR